MRAITRGAAVLALLLPLLVAGAAPCRACECEQRTPGRVIEEADLLFVGEVIGDRVVGQGTAQRFRVDRVFVGAMPPEVEIYAAIGRETVDSCAVLFSPGTTVAVALRRGEDGQYRTGVCDMLSVDTVERIAGEGRAPDPSATFPAIPAANEGQRPPWELPWWAIVGIGAVLAVGLIAVSIARSRRRAGVDPARPVLPEDVPPPDGDAG